MPTNKHKRKVTSHASPKVIKKVKSSGILSTHPKTFALVGLLFVMLGIYLLAFEAQNNAMFGFAMLSIITGVVTTLYVNFAVPSKK